MNFIKKTENWIKKGKSFYQSFENHITSAQSIVLSFLGIILAGGILLLMPVTHAAGVDISPLDAFFTAVSAVCVTGLVTINTAESWNVFGQLIILCLIQVGGLSLITVTTVFLVNARKKVTLKKRMAIQVALNNSTLGGTVRKALFVIKGTILVESLGAVFLSLFFLWQGVPWNKAVYWGVFHSISAFCNAGFDIVGENSLIPYATQWGINIVIMLLIFLGGLGFTVWQDLLRFLGRQFHKEKHRSKGLSLQSRLCLLTTGILIFGGALLFFCAEYSNEGTIGTYSLPHKILAVFFQSITLRTAGFMTVSQNALTDASKVLSSIWMLIGGSPGGTAGGMKTLTVAILLSSVWSTMRGYKDNIVFNRCIPAYTLQKALSIVTLMFLAMLTGTLLLSVYESGNPYPHTVLDLMFEVSSALGTVGLSTGITPYLSISGKLLLMLCMFIGRIGPITLLISLYQGAVSGCNTVGYPEEEVMIG